MCNPGPPTRVNNPSGMYGITAGNSSRRDYIH